jgi:multidrug efflux system membrane fusion protein
MKKWLLITLALLSCSRTKPKTIQTPSYPVKVVQSIKQDVPIYASVIGHVDPITTINVQSRVEGTLMEQYFEEGQIVRNGELLYTIDPRPFEAKLQKAKAAYEQTLAKLKLSEDKVKRFTPLVKDEYYSQNDFDNLVKEYEANTALLKENKADIETATLNLDFCYIYCPVDGVTGISTIDPGNMIYPDQSSTMITINQIEPIYVRFYLPENQLQTLFYYKEKNPIRIEVDLGKSKSFGKLNLINNQVDMQTGMITVRGEFENKDHKLWPGEFVKTRLIYTVEKDAILIPYQVVQRTPEGPVVYVVKTDQTVDMRPVKLGQREDSNIIVNEGLGEGETVVIEGQLNLSPGAKVSVVK